MSVALTTWTLSTLGIWVSGKHAAYLEQQGNLGSVSRSDRFKANRPTTRQNPKTQKNTTGLLTSSHYPKIRGPSQKTPHTRTGNAEFSVGARGRFTCNCISEPQKTRDLEYRFRL